MDIDKTKHTLKIFFRDNEIVGEIECLDATNQHRPCATNTSDPAGGECVVQQSFDDIGWEMIEVNGALRVPVIEVPAAYRATGQHDDFEDWLVFTA